MLPNRFKSLLIAFFLSLGTFFSVAQSTVNTTNVMVAIAGLKSSEGQLLFCVFDQETGFPGKHEVACLKGQQEIKDNETILSLSLEVGKKYALSVVHDENSNGDMDTNFLGIPSEGYGFSNNAKGFMSAPSFKACSFTAEKELRLQVLMRY